MIISYSYTNASDEENLDTFYNKLSFLFQSIPKHVIIGGDMNAQIGKNENSASNRNVEHLMDFSQENELT